MFFLGLSIEVEIQQNPQQLRLPRRLGLWAQWKSMDPFVIIIFNSIIIIFFFCTKKKNTKHALRHWKARVKNQSTKKERGEERGGTFPPPPLATFFYERKKINIFILRCGHTSQNSVHKIWRGHIGMEHNFHAMPLHQMVNG